MHRLLSNVTLMMTVPRRMYVCVYDKCPTKYVNNKCPTMYIGDESLTQLVLSERPLK